MIAAEVGVEEEDSESDSRLLELRGGCQKYSQDADQGLG